MRKDFLTEPYQMLEARAAGAAGVLIIVTMLTDDEVRALLDCANQCGLFVLLEAFSAADLDRVAGLATREPASNPAPLLAGVNCRDLNTLEIDFSRFAALADHLPPGIPTVAESGVAHPADVHEVARLGYRGVLVGSALMTADGDPAAAVADLLRAGRHALEQD